MLAYFSWGAKGAFVPAYLANGALVPYPVQGFGLASSIIAAVAIAPAVEEIAKSLAVAAVG